MAIAQPQADLSAQLERLGLPRAELDAWLGLAPAFSAGAWDTDAPAASQFLVAGQRLLDRLPPRAQRDASSQNVVESVQARLRTVRVGFLRRHASELYARLTDRHSR